MKEGMDMVRAGHIDHEDFAMLVSDSKLFVLWQWR